MRSFSTRLFSLTLFALSFLIPLLAHAVVILDCKAIVILGEGEPVVNEELFRESETKNACSKCHKGPYLDFTSSRTLFWDQGGKIKPGTVTQAQTLRAILDKMQTDRWKQQNPAHRIPGVLGVEEEIRTWLPAFTP